MQNMKRRFFAYRNGVINRVMRDCNSEYPLVFGLNLQQIKTIAAEHGPDRNLAEQLWLDRRTRESQLTAPYLFPREEVTAEWAMRWLGGAVSNEAVDVMMLARLRGVPFAPDLFDRIMESASPRCRYEALRLFLNNPTAELAGRARRVAASVADTDLFSLRQIARQSLDEIDFFE
ncbi:MAG: hypothetical protein NC336_07845 [Clostridium sp.]|nr:hypothetical protein [Clostridium sp.]